MGALAHEIDPERIGVARAGFSKSNPLGALGFQEA